MYKKGYHHTEEEIAKIRQSKIGNKNPNYGKKLSLEIREKMIKSRSGKKHKPRSIEAIQKQRESLKLYYQTKEGLELKKKLSVLAITQKPRLGTSSPFSVEAKERMKIVRKKQWENPKARVNSSISHKKVWQNPEYKTMLSKVHKLNWQNPEYAEKVIRNTAIAQNRHPNGKETIVMNILKELGLNTWGFTDNGTVSYGRKRPDFMDIEKKDKVIEMFGDYWHGEKARCYEETEEGRIAYFAKFGLDTLIIWESELKDPDTVKAKIREFVKIS